MTQGHHCQDLIQLFNSLFSETEQTLLIGGGEEPIYLPKEASFLSHRIIFTQDYYASALHEVAHWCIAGKQRRCLDDSFAHHVYQQVCHYLTQGMPERAEQFKRKLLVFYSGNEDEELCLSFEDLQG